MLTVLSDLHFSEAQSTRIGPYRFNRNLPASTYQAYLSELNQIARANRIQSMELVLAGDILEISRSGFWLDGGDRPYLSNQAVEPGSSAEATILKIIEAIADEENVAETLALFRHIQDYFEPRIHLHYVLGNHDRLVNATPATRSKVRDLFGLVGGSDLLPHVFFWRDFKDQPFCLVRHGHEYDPMNFSLNVKEMEQIPAGFPEAVYGQPCLGDITTIEFGAALPRVFFAVHGLEEIVADATLMALYRRLMEFDDVRPTTALLAYIFSTPGVKKRKTWELMKPCFARIIQELRNNPFFMEEIRRSEALSKGRRILLQGFLSSDLLARGLPYWMVKQLMKNVSKKIKLTSPAKWAKREALIKEADSGCQCVISGHTHFPEVSLLSARKGNERYYINTGTWRNVIPATRKFKHFGRLKAMTKVIVFRPMEQNKPVNEPDWSFHFLNGVSFGNHRHIL